MNRKVYVIVIWDVMQVVRLCDPRGRLGCPVLGSELQPLLSERAGPELQPPRRRRDRNALCWTGGPPLEAGNSLVCGCISILVSMWFYSLSLPKSSDFLVDRPPGYSERVCRYAGNSFGNVFLHNAGIRRHTQHNCLQHSSPQHPPPQHVPPQQTDPYHNTN